MFDVIAQLGLGGMEYVLLLIIIAVILFFGPRYVPQLMNALGRAKGELTRGKLEVEKELQEEFPEPKLSEPKQQRSGK